jgi:ribonuclease HII
MPPPPSPSRPKLSELKRRHLTDGSPAPAGLIDELLSDPRAGARQLGRALARRRTENRIEGQRLRHMLKFELTLWDEGFERIAGVDEAGMAPLAGPVCAGAAILPKGYKLRGLDDSKKILDPARREALAEAVKRDAVAWAVGWAAVEEIDEINIYHAGLLAMRRAVEGLAVTPDYLLVDARRIPSVPQPQRGIIRGDAQSLSIAAGAILAKTSRDRLMAELDLKHPGYGFAAHKGYPTPEHLAAIDRLGILPFHRRSFAPVRRALGLEPTQAELFAEPPRQRRGAAPCSQGVAET